MAVVRVFMSSYLDFIHDLIKDDKKNCDALIRKSLSSRIELMNTISEHIIKSGGKRLRPLLVLLSAKAFGYQEGEAHIKLAAIIELLHTATLLHDDVVDHSELRRNQPTANKVWGDQSSVLVGDYLYSRAFQLMVDVNNMTVLALLARASNEMAEGEMLQLLNCHQPDITEDNYRNIIYCKTGTLFAAAAQMGPVLMNADPKMIEAMAQYGLHLGAAFQLIDDALDYEGESEEMGKNRGDDLAEGKPTLPFIRALSQVDLDSQKLLKQGLVDSADINTIEKIIKIIESTDAISYTYEAAKQEAMKALDYLQGVPESVYRTALQQLVEFAVARRY